MTAPPPLVARPGDREGGAGAYAAEPLRSPDVPLAEIIGAGQGLSESQKGRLGFGPRPTGANEEVAATMMAHSDGGFPDDLSCERKKRKRRRSDGKKKGNLELAKVFNKRFGGGFSRSVGSGNRWGQVAVLPKHAQEVFSGDLIVPRRFKWVLESKGGYGDLDLNSVFVGGSKELDGFLDQVAKDGERCGRKPMLCWKQDRKPWLAFVPTKELEGYGFKYRLLYREWSAVALDELLKLPDQWFLKEPADTKAAKETTSISDLIERS